MPQNKTRLHKLVFDIINENNLDFTRAEAADKIETYGVLVDGNLVKNRLEWIETGTNYQIDISQWPQKEEFVIEALKIVKETENFLAIYKPVGVVVQSGAGHKKDNLIEFLKGSRPEMTKNFDKDQFPNFGLVHRLDKLTQGLLLIAKTPEALNFYQDQFRSRFVTKKYLAIVEGLFENGLVCLNYQAKDKKNPLRQKLFWTEKEAQNYSSNYRNAHSIFRPLLTDNKQTLIEVEIKTGRMHQIRLQCEQIGFPVAKDSVYNHVLKPKAFEVLSNFKPEIVSMNSFNSIKNKVFFQTQSYLLSNFLKFRDLDQTSIELSIFESGKLLDI